MAGITRKTAQIFASALTPTGNVEAFGSKAGGSPVWTADPAAIQTPQWLQGLLNSLAAGNAPYWQDLNGILPVLSYMSAYALERGIPEWDSGTTYNTDDFCRIGRILYVSNVDANTNNNPATDATRWTNYTATTTGPNVAKAWVVFDGTGPLGNINPINGYNIASVFQNSNGTYTVTFTNPIGGNPCMTGNCQGLVRLQSGNTNQFNFDTAGVVGGGTFTPQQYPLVCCQFFSS